MIDNEYVSYVKDTLRESTGYVKDSFIKRLREKNLINTDTRKKKLPKNMIDVSMYPNKIEQINHILDSSDSAIGEFEQYEFERAYRYSIICKYKTDGFDNLIDLLRSSSNIQETSECTNEKIFSKPSIAYLKISNNRAYLKFNYKYKIYDQFGKTIVFKYPVIVKFFDNGLLDIRFDRLQTKLFDSSSELFLNSYTHIRAWIAKELNITIMPVDLQPVTDKIYNSIDNVELFATSIQSKTGGSATLKVNNNFVLPILGQLKDLMDEKQEEFNKYPKIKKILDDFIKEIEITSDYPWVSLCWINESTNTASTTVKFTFNHMQEGYTLLQYIGNLHDSGRMDKVVECISKNME